MNPVNQDPNFKRRYPRRVFNGLVGVLYRGQYTLTQAGSLGEGGLSIFWPQSLPVETLVVVTFKIPGDTLISIRAEVRNSTKTKEGPHPYHLGLQFVPLPIGDRRRIRNFISSRPDSEPFI